MPTIRDVVKVLGNRAGVDAVIVLGRDGLPIDSRIDGSAAARLDPDSVAALVPPIVESCCHLGEAGDRGSFRFGVVEFNEGMAVLSELTPDTLLAILVKPGINIGQLLFELRRHKAAIAQLL